MKINHPTNKDIEHLLGQISAVNLAPVRNVQPWFPTSEHEITFRVATDEEVLYISFPASIEETPAPEARQP